MVLLNKIYNETVKYILKCKEKDDISNSIWKQFYKDGRKYDKKHKISIKILILNAPCNGFGDLIFAIKLSDYLKKWYDSEVTIATTLESGLLSLGADSNYVVGLESVSKNNQCRRFAKMKFNKIIQQQDLILVAPMQIDYYPSFTDVKKLIPYASYFNTFYFSEYNDHMDKKFTFNTGIGNKRDGIFLTKTENNKDKPLGLKNPYSVIYVAESINNVKACIISFIEMVAKKYYNKYKNLDIIVPSWFSTHISLHKKIVKTIKNYYQTINIITKDSIEKIDTYIFLKKENNTLNFRCDILPVPNKIMINLMKKSIPDILLTGDQSITDAISCCKKKNIFYQIAPWKTDLAKNLAKELPNSYLNSTRTSCGSLKAINYNSNYEKFSKKWDFRKRSKSKMDAIVLSIIAIKTSQKFGNLILLSRNSTLKVFKNKIK